MVVVSGTRLEWLSSLSDAPEAKERGLSTLGLRPRFPRDESKCMNGRGDNSDSKTVQFPLSNEL